MQGLKERSGSPLNIIDRATLSGVIEMSKLKLGHHTFFNIRLMYMYNTNYIINTTQYCSLDTAYWILFLGQELEGLIDWNLLVNA